MTQAQPPTSNDAARQARAFLVAMLTIVAMEFGSSFLNGLIRVPQPLAYMATLAAFSLAFTVLAALLHRFGPTRWVRYAVVTVLAFGLYLVFPERLINHWAFLAWALLPIVAVRIEVEADAADLVAYWRLLFVGMLFGAGLQKLFFGLFDHAELLVYLSTQAPERLNGLFLALLPSEQVQLLTAAPAQIGGGPYRSEDWLPRAVGLAAVACELALPALLLTRFRVAAAVATALFLLAVQIEMGIWYFAFYSLPFLLLFAPPAWQRRAWLWLFLPPVVHGALKIWG